MNSGAGSEAAALCLAQALHPEAGGVGGAGPGLPAKFELYPGGWMWGRQEGSKGFPTEETLEGFPCFQPSGSSEAL